MKKIAYLLLFIAVFVLLLALSSRFFEPKNNIKEQGIENVKANGILGEESNTIEVLVIGDSEAYSSISPMQIYQDKGYTTYVCATSAQFLFESNNYLNKTLKSQKPKVVILETNCIFREFSLGNKIAFSIANYISVFKYHDLWKKLNINNFTKKIDYTYTDDYKGFYLNKEIVPSKKTNHMKYTDQVKKIPKTNLTVLNDIIKTCNNNDIKLLLLSTPSTVNWNYKKHNAIKEYALENSIEYIDLNLKNLKINWYEDTRDAGDHMNYNGAMKVTNYVSTYLEQLNILNDYRGGKLTKWDHSLEKYLKEASLL